MNLKSGVIIGAVLLSLILVLLGCVQPPICGDGICNGGESQYNCPVDCGKPSYCGDGLCDAGAGEDQYTCSVDCGSPPVLGKVTVSVTDYNTSKPIENATIQVYNCSDDPSCVIEGAGCYLKAPEDQRILVLTRNTSVYGSAFFELDASKQYCVAATKNQFRVLKPLNYPLINTFPSKIEFYLTRVLHLCNTQTNQKEVKVGYSTYLPGGTQFKDKNIRVTLEDLVQLETGDYQARWQLFFDSNFLKFIQKGAPPVYNIRKEFGSNYLGLGFDVLDICFSKETSELPVVVISNSLN